ncbi:hypothetical protein [Marinobacterium sp. MBR-109]|jgi:hypothetical protein|uniref:hypothetical protein n=1 Tax=Marinobacterium sp. MBR-109 TaxID=3156462 RepID=UPI003399AB4E
MSLSWSLSENLNPFVPEEKGEGLCFHAAQSSVVDDVAVKDAIEAALERAIGYLDANVKNESLYFMVEWALPSSTLRLAVTDERKCQDSSEVVSCRFSELNQQLHQGGDLQAEAQALSDKVKFWAKDYLSTNTEFMNYSLVALYTDGTRAEAKLL